MKKKDTDCPNCGRDWKEWQHEDTTNSYNSLEDKQVGEMRHYSCKCGTTISGIVWAEIKPTLDFEMTQWDEPSGP